MYAIRSYYDIGDVVEINGVAGVVERMTLRVVAVRDLSGVLHIIPNGVITIVSNKTSEWSRAVLDIGVAYKEDVITSYSIHYTKLYDCGARRHRRSARGAGRDLYPRQGPRTMC